jgi:hypothetical protein
VSSVLTALTLRSGPVHPLAIDHPDAVETTEILGRPGLRSRQARGVEACPLYFTEAPLVGYVARSKWI